jgi:glucose-6-phosphate 1-epimerase
MTFSDLSLAEQMQQLYQQYGELAGITIELHKELLAINIENKAASATVFLQGAQLSHYQQKEQQPTLWCSEQCDYKTGQSLRGGIPICWPWFGDIERNPQSIQQQFDTSATSIEQAPAHGFARNIMWQLDNITIDSDEQTQLTLSLDTQTNAPDYWPYPCRLQLLISVGKQLSLRLVVENNSQQALTFSNALHTYFATSDIDQTQISGLENLSFQDCVDDWQIKTQTGSVCINQEVDRIYQGSTKAISIHDKQWQRTTVVSSEGSSSAVLWNPWIEKSTRLSQFKADDYQHMLCIETANVMDDCRQVDAGESYALELTITSTSLSD